MTNLYADQVTISTGELMSRLTFIADKEVTAKVYIPNFLIPQIIEILQKVLARLAETQKRIEVPQ